MIGVECLAKVCAAAGSIPVVAIGGVSSDNLQGAMRVGCAGVAVVSAVFAAPDVRAATRALRSAVDATLKK